MALLQALSAQSARVPAQLAQLAARLAAGGVILGSHDDASPQTRAQWRAMGVGLCEFPETHAAAQAARDGGDGIVLGAPNVVRGGSHSGNVRPKIWPKLAYATRWPRIIITQRRGRRRCNWRPNWGWLRLGPWFQPGPRGCWGCMTAGKLRRGYAPIWWCWMPGAMSA